jgi:MFS family permease
MVHLVPYARDLGYREASAVGLLSLIGSGSLAGRFVMGPFADRWGARKSLIMVSMALSLLLVLWLLATSYVALAALAIAFGACYGGWVAVLPTIVMDLYGARAVASTIGFLYTGAGFGTLIGPWLTGVAYDSLGSYRVPIFASAAVGLLAAGCASRLLSGPAAPERSATA